MSIPNIDTFEHDISEEIKTKEATIGDIAAAGGDIGNVTTKSTPVSTLLVALGVFLVVAVIAVSIILFVKYFNQPEVTPTMTLGGGTVPSAVSASSVSVSIESAVGPSISNIQKSEYGYVVRLISYSNVFSYMIKNEAAYADEIAASVGSPRDTSTTTPQFMFTDVTINNQNMRVGVAGSSTVVYSFVNTDYLLISSTPEGILALRGGILR